MNFASDNTAPASPEILAALQAVNEGAVPSYGADTITARLRERLAATFEHDLVAHPVATGTAANALALATLVHPYGAVICAEEAHIATDECGAPEFYTGGAKLITLPSADGKILPGQIEAVMARATDGGVHHVLPEAVSIAQATEWGTVYTPAEIAAIAAVCKRHGLKLHMDGARFANALVHEGCKPAALSWQAGVDVMSFGATKNGAMAAEAVLFFDPALAEGFERRRKRAGQLWSKLRYLSAQLDAYLDGGLWLRNAGHANAMATRLAQGLSTVPGVHLVQQVQANEVFAAMPDSLITALLAEGAYFYRWISPAGPTVAGEPPVARLVTSFSTPAPEVEAFLALTHRLAGGAATPARHHAA
jgi:threonine aldolase